MAGTDITKSSMSPKTTVVRQGQTANGAFGSDPSAKVKGSRSTRDLTVPNAK